MSPKYDPNAVIDETVTPLLATISRSLNMLYAGGAQIVPNIPAEAAGSSKFTQSPLAGHIRTLCRVANGEAVVSDHRIHAQQRNDLIEAMKAVMDLLFPMRPNERVREIQPAFYFTLLGRIYLRCEAALRGEDDAITISEAARKLYGSAGAAEQARVARMIERREIQAWIDPDEPNPQRARRVSRTEVSLLAISLKLIAK